MTENFSTRELQNHFENLGQAIKGVGSDVKELDKKLDNQTAETAKLKLKQSWFMGLGTGAVFLFSLIIGLVVYSFKLSIDNAKQAVLLEVNQKSLNASNFQTNATQLTSELVKVSNDLSK
jgi:hypothetical protein